MGNHSSKLPTSPLTNPKDANAESKEISKEQVDSTGNSLVAALQRCNIDALSNILQYESLDVVRQAWKEFHIFHWVILTACTFSQKQMQNVSDLLIEHKDKVKDLIQAAGISSTNDKYLRVRITPKAGSLTLFVVEFSTSRYQIESRPGHWTFTTNVPPSSFALMVQANIPFSLYGVLDHTTLLLTMLKSLQDSHVSSVVAEAKVHSDVPLVDSGNINHPVASSHVQEAPQPPAYSIAANAN